MSDIERAIAKALDLEERATPGPWNPDHRFGNGYVKMPSGRQIELYSDNGQADGDLIVFDRNTHRLTWDVVEAGSKILDAAPVSDLVSGRIHLGELRSTLDALARAVNSTITKE